MGDYRIKGIQGFEWNVAKNAVTIRGFAPWGNLLAAYIPTIRKQLFTWAAGMETTATRWIDRTGYITFQADL